MRSRLNAAVPPVGPHRADEIRAGDPYELSDGYLVHCLPTGQRGGQSTIAGALVLDTDPAVGSSGIDTGFSPKKTMLRAPDIAIGGIEDKPGWSPGVPPLAVEYADTGQDEPELQKKIRELLREGTRLIWVVRLNGPRRVEVYAPGAEMQVVHPGGALEAPGILQNAVPVEALYDRREAHRWTLRNLLQREGFESLEAVREHEYAQGRLVEARAALRRVLARRGLSLSAAEEALIDACPDPATLARCLEEAVVAGSAAEALRAISSR